MATATEQQTCTGNASQGKAAWLGRCNCCQRHARTGGVGSAARGGVALGAAVFLPHSTSHKASCRLRNPSDLVTAGIRVICSPSKRTEDEGFPRALAGCAGVDAGVVQVAISVQIGRASCRERV